MRLLSAQGWRDGWWVRLGTTGPGLQCFHRREEPVFSEREGIRRFWPKWPGPRWFPYRFRLLSRFRPQRVTITYNDGRVWNGEVYSDDERLGPRFRVEDECL
jgi:hypothetical protein